MMVEREREREETTLLSLISPKIREVLEKIDEGVKKSSVFLVKKGKTFIAFWRNGNITTIRELYLSTIHSRTLRALLKYIEPREDIVVIDLDDNKTYYTTRSEFRNIKTINDLNEIIILEPEKFEKIKGVVKLGWIPYWLLIDKEGSIVYLKVKKSVTVENVKINYSIHYYKEEGKGFVRGCVEVIREGGKALIGDYNREVDEENIQKVLGDIERETITLIKNKPKNRSN
mgnify:CR=1 FL=1